MITTPFSFVASSNVLLFERAVPIFVDVDPQTGNIDPALVQAAAEDLQRGSRAARQWLPRQGTSARWQLKGILPVDVFGQPADMDAINGVARKHGLTVIEDACEALGAQYKGKLAGGLGESGVFAFYPNKQITTGEGAMIVTDDDQAAAAMRAMRNQGRAPGDTWLQHTYLGYNYRLDEMSAALGRVQIGRIEELLSKREQVAGWYAQRLSEIPGVEAPRLAATTSRASWFVYVIRFAAGINRDEVARRLGEQGHSGATVLPADPPAALHGGAIRLPTRRFSSDGRPGTEGVGYPILGRDERKRSRPGVPGAARCDRRLTDWMRVFGAQPPAQDVNTTSSLPVSLSWMRLTTISMCRDSCTKSRSSVRMVSTGQTSKPCSQSS